MNLNDLRVALFSSGVLHLFFLFSSGKRAVYNGPIKGASIGMILHAERVIKNGGFAC